MKSIRTSLRQTALIALTLLLCWVAVGVIHQHSEDPTCEICKLLHSGVTHLGIAASSLEPGAACERLSAAPSDKHSEAPLPAYQVRGPPLS